MVSVIASELTLNQLNFAICSEVDQSGKSTNRIRRFLPVKREAKNCPFTCGFYRAAWNADAV